MKRQILVLACCFSMTLTACQAPSELLNKYSEIDLLKSSDVLSLVDPERTEGFASHLAVVSVADNAATTGGAGKSVSVDDDLGKTIESSSETGQPSDDPVDIDESFPDNENGSGAENGDENTQETITANSAFLVRTNTDEALFYKNIYAPLAPASLTKLLTALMVLKYGNMDDEVTITKEMITVDNPAAQMCGFAVGDKVSVRELFNCMLVYSGNDTSMALGVYISGSEEAFAQLMNSEAKKLGAVDTNYVNACGLDADGHLTCTYDLYLMFNECLKYPEFREAIDKKEYTTHYTNAAGEAVEKTFPTTNLYLTGDYAPPEGIHVFGGKTGTTDNAGTCLILYTTDSSENTYISIVLGSPDKPELYQQMSKLLSIIQKN